VRLAMVPLGAIRVDHSKNVIRGGLFEGFDRFEVKKLEESIETLGLLQPVGLRDLPTAVPKSKDAIAADPLHVTDYLFEPVYGFRRVSIYQKKNAPEIPAVLLGALTDAEARERNAAENTDREDVTEYQLAHYFYLLAETEQITMEEVARRCRTRAPYVETLVRIVTRCPREMLEQWHFSPTPMVRRVLDRISRIEGLDDRDTKRQMFDEWAKFLSENDGQPGNRSSADEPRQRRSPRAMGQSDIDRFRGRVDVSSEVNDPISGWRPLSEGERQIIHAILRHVKDPKHVKSPLR
jgi:hypothetical protein